MSEVEDAPEINPIFEGMRQEDANNVTELVKLGHLSRDYEFCGHTFGLQTLRADADLAVGVALKDWQDNAKQPQMWAAAHVGMALTHIDGDDAFCPPTGPNKGQFAKARLAWVTGNYFMPVIMYLYERYCDLLEEQQRAIEALQEATQDF